MLPELMQLRGKRRRVGADRLHRPAGGGRPLAFAVAEQAPKLGIRQAEDLWARPRAPPKCRVDSWRQRPDQLAPGSAGRADRAHAASRIGALGRKPTASRTSSARTRTRPSRSAIVRATRSTRSWPLPVRPRPAPTAPRAGRASGSGRRVAKVVRGPIWPLQRARGPRRAACSSRAARTRARTIAVDSGPDAAGSGRGRRRVQPADEVDAVEQGTAEPPPVAGDLHGPAVAAAIAVPARAVVAGRDERSACGELEGPLGAGDRDRSTLQRLPQRLERMTRELGELVEEEHTPVGEGDLAGPWARAAADQPSGGDRVVGRTKGPLGGEAAIAQPGHRADPGDLERLVEVGRRQEPRQPPGQHRLPCSRRTRP